MYLENESCNEIICHPVKQVKEQFQYLNDNNFFTINTTELRLYIENKLKLPKKTVLITIDDGAFAWNFPKVLEEYKINATLFLVTSWYSEDKFKSDYLEIASHTDNLHITGQCPGDQGSPLKCKEKDFLLNDLKKSREKLNQTEAFCYPFYEFNDYTISIVKEAGFKMAFAGGTQKARVGTDLFKIPRITMLHDTTLDEYIRVVN